MEKAEIGKYAIEPLAQGSQFWDTYDAARCNQAAWEAVDTNWRGGIEHIFKTFEDKLGIEGLEAFQPIRNLHEALESVTCYDDASQNEKIIRRNKRGYKLERCCIRPAKG